MSEREQEKLSTADLASAGEREYATPDQEAAALNPPQPVPSTASQQPPAAHPAPLFAPADANGLRSLWDNIQAGFVDDPNGVVQQADGLVAEVIKRLADTCAAERANLQKQWSGGEKVSTEDLRLALQRYRSFLDRLLSI